MAADHLSERLKDAGEALLAATDALGMRAQGAMWIFDHGLDDWRYYLVTSLVDTLGRRKTYRLLLDAFDLGELPEEMTVEDVHLGSPNDRFFQSLAMINVADGERVDFENTIIGGELVDGVMYRSVKEPPSVQEAALIEHRFSKTVRALGDRHRRNKEKREEAAG